MTEAAISSPATLRAAAARSLTGQVEPFEQVLIALLNDEHCLLAGAAGTGKLRLAACFARWLGLSLGVVRGFPELTPGELTGSRFAADDARRLTLPMFQQVVLIEDVDQLSPRAAAALQQAVTERRLADDGCLFSLPRPQLLLPTIYPDDDGQFRCGTRHDDRFLFQVRLACADYAVEYLLTGVTDERDGAAASPLAGPSDLVQWQAAARQVSLPPPVVHYILRLVRSTRINEESPPDFVYEWLQSGAGPRAVRGLAAAARTRAALQGRTAATAADVQALAHAVLRHRIVTNRNARSTGVGVDDVIDRLLYETAERADGDEAAPGEGAGDDLAD